MYTYVTAASGDDSRVVTFLSRVPFWISASSPFRPIAAGGIIDATAAGVLALDAPLLLCFGGVFVAADDEGRSHVVTFVCGL